MDDVETLFQQGRAAWARNDLTAAEPPLRQALAAAPANPAIRAALGSILLKSGRLAEGFPLFDAWREMPDRAARVAPRLPFTPWRGQPVDGRRVLVWSEDGFGDQLMYARFARQLVQRGAYVSWMCAPPLARLFTDGLGGVQIMPADQPADLSCDFYCPSSALPRGFDLTLQTLPNAPYLDAPPPRAVNGRIGVMTRGNLNNVEGRPRSLSPEQAARLQALPGAIDLDPAATGVGDFYDTATIIAGLDLIISIDTAVAHLAGAMGKPVWVLVPFVADWRWLDGEHGNPWYPTARILRQDADRDWVPVVERVVREIEAP
jgi:hypothetical protein